MPDVTYEIVQHDGGWAYKVDGVFSETFPTHAEALAAGQAAAEQQGGAGPKINGDGGSEGVHAERVAAQAAAYNQSGRSSMVAGA
jgi:hypothetical protein